MAGKRIDFAVSCSGALLNCPACGAASQPVHDRLRRSWRHLDFFQFEAWLHADAPRVVCGGGKTTQLGVPWARQGSGFEFYVEQARVVESFEDVAVVGIDETSLRRGQDYVTVVHDLDAKRLLFATPGRDHQTVLEFVATAAIRPTCAMCAST